jgi:hypothetical protein
VDELGAVLELFLPVAGNLISEAIVNYLAAIKSDQLDQLACAEFGGHLFCSQFLGMHYESRKRARVSMP